MIMVTDPFLQAVIDRRLHIVRNVSSKPCHPVSIVRVTVLSRCGQLLHRGASAVAPLGRFGPVHGTGNDGKRSFIGTVVFLCYDRPDQFQLGLRVIGRIFAMTFRCVPSTTRTVLRKRNRNPPDHIRPVLIGNRRFHHSSF